MHLLSDLNALTDKDFVELVTQALTERSKEEGRSYKTQERWVLGIVDRVKSEEDNEWSSWNLRLVSSERSGNWSADALLCQEGSCCGFKCLSWTKQSLCPICNGIIHAT